MPPTERPSTPWNWTDVIVIGSIVAFWLTRLYPEVTTRWPVGFDTLRDTAASMNILCGTWLSDPLVANQTYWYAPLGSIVFAGISFLTRQDVVFVYASSILWFNIFLPVGWYLLARECWDSRLAGFAGAVLVWWGSLWWSTHVALPVTSVQGTLLLIVAILLWLWSMKRALAWSLLVGVALAVCSWWHIISGVLACCVIAIHAFGWTRSFARDIESASRRHYQAAIALVACGILVAPLVWHMVTLPRVNLEPIEYQAAELLDPSFALQIRTLPVFILAAIGVVEILRKARCMAGVLIGYVLIGLIGQGFAYSRILFGFRIPIVTPHEFQWNFQIAVGLLAAGGVVRLSEWIRGFLGSRWRQKRLLESLLVCLILVPAIGGGAVPAVKWYDKYWLPTRLEYSTQQAVDWIKDHTAVSDVFLSTYPTNYFVIGGRTGRKLVCPPPGHSSIAVSWEQRRRDAERMLLTQRIEEMRYLLSRYKVKYVFLAARPTPETERWLASWTERGLLRPLLTGESGSALVYGLTAVE